MDNIIAIGIDVAKNVFQICAVNKGGKIVKTKRLSRPKLISWVVQLPKECQIFMEACGTAHYWARQFVALGFSVKLIAPQFVKPFVKSNKNDCNDAAAIVEAGLRPTMRFVPMKTVEQQDIQSLHRVRSLAIKQRTMYSNQIRSFLAEYGVVFSAGIHQLRGKLTDFLEDAENALTDTIRGVASDLYRLFREVDTLIKTYDKKIEMEIRSKEVCQRLMKLPGVGPMIASAFVAAVGDGSDFRKGRDVSAWLGLVPRHRASGHKIQMQGISKRGDVYLRTLIIHGARSVLQRCDKKTDRRNIWAKDKKVRLGFNSAVVALANKTAREMWAVLSKGEAFNFSV